MVLRAHTDVSFLSSSKNKNTNQKKKKHTQKNSKSVLVGLIIEARLVLVEDFLQRALALVRNGEAGDLE